MLSFRGTFELVAVSVTTACVDVRGLLEAVVSVGCEITACFVDKGWVVVCEVIVVLVLKFSQMMCGYLPFSLKSTYS